MSTKLFKCDICDKTFTRKYNLNRHILSVQISRSGAEHTYTTQHHEMVKRGKFIHEILLNDSEAKEESIEKNSGDYKALCLYRSNLVKRGQFIHEILESDSEVKEEAIKKGSENYEALRLYRSKINTERIAYSQN